MSLGFWDSVSAKDGYQPEELNTILSSYPRNLYLSLGLLQLRVSWWHYHKARYGSGNSWVLRLWTCQYRWSFKKCRAVRMKPIIDSWVCSSLLVERVLMCWCTCSMGNMYMIISIYPLCRVRKLLLVSMHSSTEYYGIPTCAQLNEKQSTKRITTCMHLQNRDCISISRVRYTQRQWPSFLPFKLDVMSTWSYVHESTMTSLNIHRSKSLCGTFTSLDVLPCQYDVGYEFTGLLQLVYAPTRTISVRDVAVQLTRNQASTYDLQWMTCRHAHFMNYLIQRWWSFSFNTWRDRLERRWYLLVDPDIIKLIARASCEPSLRLTIYGA